MKKITRKLSLILTCLMMTLLVSCDNDYPNDGYFKVGGKTYYLNDAILQDVGYADGYYQLRLELYNNNNNELHSINFLLYSEVSRYLPSGNYTPYVYDGEYDHKFKRGAWMKSKSDVESVILLGNVKVTADEEIYTISINCKDHNNESVTGEYKGEITVRN